MTRKSLLMLSDDAHVVRACADLGVDLTVACGLPQADFGRVAIPSADRQLFLESAHDVETVLLGLYRAGIDPSSFDGVYSTDEGGVTAAAFLGQALGIPSMSPRVAALCRDKSLAKAALSAAGVPTADFIVIDDLCELPADFEVPFAPAVLKPVSGGATYYTSVIRSSAELQEAAKRARADRRFRTYILESFVPGDEYHLNGVVFDGELRFLSVGGYVQPCLTAVSNNQWLRTFVFDPVQDAAVYERVTPMAEQALRVLGLRAGVFHMEMFYDAEHERLTFGECAARRGGGCVEEEVLHKFGVSLAEAAAQCALGIEPTLKPEIRPAAVGAAFLPYVPGLLVSHPTEHELMALPNVEYAMVEWPIGFDMEPMVSTIMKMGHVLFAADSRAELFKRMDEVVSWFQERTVAVPPGATPRELLRWQAGVKAAAAARAEHV
ncbi:ATP-grasp domain-containing protein [Dactylosporangium sp. NBC_01737]|uniref:ATP-grasp domain-containing protein n=1 Tax=Dactylosporangium sp. NBC_01737 TaxID=2975959 RepID=UPI002E0F90F0|nr:ATP-grasp domain-containing protein [Dactylosporangium sp. NBC_01737]